MPARTRRTAAALVALVCWAGLALQFSVTFGEKGDIPTTLWLLGRYFTEIGNLAVALAMTAVAFGRRVSPVLIGGVTMAILLVAIVYAVLLAGLHPLHGRVLVANRILHRASPAGTVIFWLFFTPHRRLRWSAPLWWGVFPLGYFAYAVVRGSIDGHYPYPFMDVARIGLAHTLLNAAVIAAAFLAVGYALVWLDHRRLLGSVRTAR